MTMKQLLPELLSWIWTEWSRLSVLLTAFLIFLGLSIALTQATRQYNGLLRELQIINIERDQREVTLQAQFSTLARDMLKQYGQQAQENTASKEGSRVLQENVDRENISSRDDRRMLQERVDRENTASRDDRRVLQYKIDEILRLLKTKPE